MTSEWTIFCLRDTGVWFFGDSNGARLYNMISAKVIPNYAPGKWRYERVIRDNSNGITLKLIPLEYPLFLGPWWEPRIRYGGIAKHIDKIPSTGKHVVLFHNYLHLSHYHLSTAFPRLTALPDAIQRLLKRNPEVLVGIRGPHVSSFDQNFNHAVGGDNLGTYLIKMIRNIFADLKDKVVFLDGWEMTLAMENPTFHPDDCVPLELSRTLLAFKCS